MRPCSAIPALFFILWAPWTLAQESKPSDCLKQEHSIRPPDLAGGNAAVEYFKVWDSLPTEEYKAISAYGNVPFKQTDPIVLAPAQRDLCLTHQNYIEALMRCASMPTCDWGVPHDAGPEAGVFHYGLMRSAYRALLMDFWRCLEDKNPAAAAERLAATIRMSDQFRSDGLWIAVYVGAAMVGGAAGYTDDFIKGGLLTVPAAKTLLSAYRSIRQDDLFGAAAASPRERWIAVEWARTKFSGPYAGAMYVGDTVGINPDQPLLRECMLLTMGQERFGKELDRFDAYLGRVLPLWAKPGKDTELRELETQAAEGQFGVLASLQAWEVDQVRRSMERARRLIARAIAELDSFVKEREAKP